MTINIKKFKKGDFKKPRHKKINHPIVILLKSNKDLAFTEKEITRRVKMNANTVRSMLGKLVQDKKVLHKSPYYAWRK